MTINNTFHQKLNESIINNYRLITILPNTSLIKNVHSAFIQNNHPNPSILCLYQSYREIDLSDIIYIKHADCDRVLGNTFNILILLDFDSTTPNILAKSMETIQGGGIIIIINKSTNFSLFYDRLRKSLELNENVLIFDDSFEIIQQQNKKNVKVNIKDELNIIKTTQENINKKSKLNSDDLKNQIDEDMKTSLYSLAKTEDQKKILITLEKILSENNIKTTCSITAARGRGKSAAMGLIVALATYLSFSNINITAPSIENTKTLFDFILKGLEVLNYKEKVHFNVRRIVSNKKKYINKIMIHKTIIQYVNPHEEINGFTDLFIIDEAAAIPIPHIKRMLNNKLVFMSTTINGYEGTGRSLTLKLFEELKKGQENNFKEFTLSEPIRYALNDPIERWLNETLLLNVKPPKIGQCPAPDNCELFYINKEVLFKYHKLSEMFLKDMVSLFVTSHYKNSPDDLLNMCDNHHLFALLTPIEENKMPQVLCAVQIVYENNSKTRDGNLIPWVLYDNYLLDNIWKLKGIRIVRIAVHPDYMSMGYGSRALKLFTDFFFHKSSKILNSEQDNILSDKINSKEANKTNIEITTNHNSLLISLDDIKISKIDYIGSSFGATSKLINFWKNNDFKPIYLRQMPSATTGEFSTIVIQTNDIELNDLDEKFKKRFYNLLSSSFKNLHPTLCLNFLYPLPQLNVILDIDAHDKQRIESFCKGQSDIQVIYDLLPKFAEKYFMEGKIKSTVLEQCILLMIGAQFKNMDEIAKTLKVERNVVTGNLNRIIIKLWLEYNK